MADRIYRNVGADGRVTLTDQAPRGTKPPQSQSLNELDALLAATSGDAAMERRQNWTPIEGEGPFVSTQPAQDALTSSASLQQLLDLIDREQNPYPSDIPTAEEGELLDQSTPGGVLRRAADVAAVPGSLLPSPLQPVAAGWQALRGVQQAVNDPSLMNIGMAGLMAAPLAGTARRLLPGPAARGAITGPPGPRPQKYGDTFARGQWHRTTPPQVAPEAAQGGNMRRMGLLPFDEGAGGGPTMRQTFERGGYFPQDTPASMAAVQQAAPESLESLVNQALRQGEQTLKKVPAGKRMKAPRPAPQTPIQRGEATVFPPKLGGRVGDVHEAQTTGGMFGFDDLPELSEAELLRLQRSF